MSLMPYLWAASRDATATGIPLMRPMQLAFPGDPGVAYLDRQYMLGPDILVAPVFTATGEVDFYLPQGSWTSLLTGEVVAGGGWRRETHGFDSLPLYVRSGAIIPRGSRRDRPDYDYLEGLVLDVYPSEGPAERIVPVYDASGRFAEFTVSWSAGTVEVSSAHDRYWSVRVGTRQVAGANGRAGAGRGHRSGEVAHGPRRRVDPRRARRRQARADGTRHRLIPIRSGPAGVDDEPTVVSRGAAPTEAHGASGA